MKKILSVFSILIITSSAAYGSEPVMANWSGPYAGLIAGRSMGDGSINDPSNFAFFDDADGYVPLKPSGNYAGALVGMNWQTGPVVYGVEADYAFGSASDSTPTAYPGTLDWGNIGTTRARLGYATGKALFYVTGGAAVSKINNKVFYDPLPCGTSGTVCDEKTRIGMVMGLGAEAMLNPKVSLKLEYNRINFKDATLDNNGGAFYTFKNRSDFIKFGLNYHF